MKSVLTLMLASVMAVGPSLDFAGDKTRMETFLGRLGTACTDRLRTSFPDVPISDLHVAVGASFRESLDNGSTDLEDLQKSGAFYQIEVPGKGSGSCGVNAKGKIIEFSISKN